MGDGDDEEKVSLGAKVPRDYHQRVRVAAAKRGMNISEYVRLAVNRQLEEDEGDSNRNPAEVLAD